METPSVGECPAHLGAESRRRQVMTLIHQQTIQQSGADGTHFAVGPKVGADLHLDASASDRRDDYTGPDECEWLRI